MFSADDRAAIIPRVIDAFGSVAGETIKAGTSVRIVEVWSSGWGWGGKLLTSENAKAMRAKG